MGSLPFIHRHTVDQFARGGLVPFETGIEYPVGQAVAAKTGQAHQVDILRVMAVLQMPHQPPERLRRNRVGQLIQFCRCIGRRIRIHCGVPHVSTLSCNTALA